MAASEASAFLSQADFARRRGVSRKSVTTWKNRGLLVISDAGLVDVEKTEWNLDQRPANYRGGVTHRPIRTAPGNSGAGNKPKSAQATSGRAKPVRPSDRDDDDGGGQSVFDPNSPNLTLPQAVARKENFLGLQRKQAFEKGERALVDRAVARKLFFDTSRADRDAWQNWPARIAVTMADDLKIDARTLTTVLTSYVQQHLAELGEPHADLD